jgi:hypothetical protein
MGANAENLVNVQFVLLMEVNAECLVNVQFVFSYW